VTLIGAAAVVTDGRCHRPGWLQTSGGRIDDCGPGAPVGPPDLDFPEATIAPGFVDMHVHGGDGASYSDAEEAATSSAAAFHRRHGTTTTLASLVTAAPDALLRAVRALTEATHRGTVAGIHLEGPWLSPRHCGAHDRRYLRVPDPAEIDALLAAADGAIRMVTLAPELPGSFDAIRRFVDAGVVVALGHTDASYEQTRQVIDAGATVGTHVFNAMRPLHHRSPGPVLALLEDPRVTLELIADGVHVHPALIHRVIDVAGPDRIALISDAIAAAGLGDGPCRLGGLDVDVVSGVARVRGTSTIAGSTATMDQLFGAVADGHNGARDAALVAAAQMTSTVPARALGFDRLGELRAGYDANLVVLDHDLCVERVMVGGRWASAQRI
jgi:N-acetylglucosamine-6-phosphate deacetylase